MEAVSHVDFAPEVLACLPKVSDDNPWSISAEERAVRLDFTGVRYLLKLNHHSHYAQNRRVWRELTCIACT